MLSGGLAGVLAAMGRVLWCACGGPSPWAGDIWSMHNSQHLADPYAISHVLHGVVFFAVFRALLGADRLVLQVAATGLVEAAWEILENSPIIIERYREATISLDYYGDSIANSVSDLWACFLGFFIARRLPWYGSVALFVLAELVMLAWIRDSLVINVIMLVSPVDAIREWQAAIAP